MDIEPAKTIIEFLGGAKAVSEIVKKHPSRIYRWAYPVSKREGCGGIIPSRDQITLLNFCRSTGVDIRPDDFFSHDRIRAILIERTQLASSDASALDMVKIQGCPHSTPANTSPSMIRQGLIHVVAP